MNKILKTLLTSAVLSIAFSMNAQALTVTYAGMVTAATGAFPTLTPVGTLVAGPVTYDDAAVATGTVGPLGILGIDVNVGGFCFTTGPDETGCPSGGAYVPIISIDAAAVTFAGTSPTGGFLDLTAFSPTFNINIPIMFDLTAGTFFANGGGLGTVEGTFAAVPIPAAAWLLGSALLGLAGLRRRS